MSIKANFTPAQVAAAMQKRVAAIESEIVRTLSREGERFVTNARNVNTYKDQTGNLRSSIGYVILKDGAQIVGSFPGSSSQGVAIGKKTAANAAAKHNKGYCLIVVAGMDYAIHVENSGRDVLTGSSIQAEVDIKKALEKLAAKITR